ncbi:GAF domain-containing protein [Microbacterium thalassium]|uniref:Signal transduction histidine kinase n=1 Tax=Microbacterium thalassium TaxID=362649 RepID=A0A7X0KTA0_9MICO|nr:GAF domain-containing protein [Microbacterium thalassium]MBB6389867.1 signal transduction histidine kinase [Microbacterium thalassium]GLK24554.1 putative histidine kinase response regulator [Microbacterium thalassium]
MDTAGETLPHRRIDDLLRASTAVVEHLDLEEVLGRIVEAAMSLVDAHYGALGVLGPDGRLERFIHRGIDPATAERIGDLPRGRGILGAVIAADRPVRLPHLSEDPRSSGFPAHHPPMESFLGVPIRVRDSVYGDLYLADARAGAFTADDEALMVSLAATAGVAIENARLYEEARARQQWSEAIADVMGALLDVDSDDALDVIVERVVPVVAADVAAVSIPCGDAEMKIIASQGADAVRLRGRIFARAGTPADRALSSGRAVSTPEQPAGALFAEQPPVGPSVAVPLLAGDEPLGVLTISREPGCPPFSDAELEMAFVFAGQAGVAIEVVRAREERRRAERTQDRTRIARDLHDHVIQRLFGAGLALQAVAMTSAEPAAAALTEQVDALDDAIKEIRTIIYALSHSPGSSRGTRDRLLSVTSETLASLPSAPRLRFSGPIDSLVTADLADDLAAVLRECLANIVKHADARVVDASLAVADERVTLTVRDDGRGIPADAGRRGLANLAERARLRGGECLIESTADAGTTVTWTVPLPDEEDTP